MSSGILSLVAAAAAASHLPPIDQCVSDPSFSEFRSELKRTIADRDREKLLAIVADDILVDFGGGQDKAAFVEHWELDRSQSSKIWAELETVLSLGCAIEGENRISPSLGEQIGRDRDAFETYIALPGAILRRTASDRSPRIARLRWDVLTQKGIWDGGDWVQVRLDNGRSGYIRRAQVRSPIDYRVRFVKADGRWRMASFVAGD